MAWSQYLPEGRVKWSQGTHSSPIWPSEPHQDAIRRVFVSALIGDSNEDDDGSDMTTNFLANGVHHKIYEVTRPRWDVSYLLRVAVAVDPGLKMESEMATMMFLRQRTTIPVPRPVAWSSSVDERLGFEWSLLEKVPGVELREVWRKMPWDKKIDITKTIATYMAQIWDPAAKQVQIGFLYFAQSPGSHRDPGTGSASSSGSSGDGNTSHRLEPHTVPRTTKADKVGQHSFAVGPVVDGAFFVGRRRFLSHDRGPYNSCRDWLTALIQVEQEFIRSARVLMESPSDAPEEYREEDAWTTVVEEEIEVDEDDFLDDYDAIMKNCADYMRVLARLFPQREESRIDTARFSMYHCDLKSANHNAQVDLHDIHHRTPLSYTAEHGHKIITRLLLYHNAQVDIPSEDGRTPLSYASAKGLRRSMHPVPNGDGHEAITRLLIEKGAQVNLQDNEHRTPLSYASDYGHETIARLLLNHNARVDVSCKDGRTPLSCASAKDRPGICTKPTGNGHEAIVHTGCRLDYVLGDDNLISSLVEKQLEYSFI